jgi:hypothetical protein
MNQLERKAFLVGFGGKNENVFNGIVIKKS